MDITEQLQKLADKVELMILSAGGDLKLGGLLSTATMLRDAENHLGEGLDALLELKAALGLTTNLKKEENKHGKL